ncbi:hypothetical protein BX616_005113 [Lobosporangium transversale]|uniref:Uncharacterized protein n=1 Tax=Lobosporangium transversale TaxID=64571 RepID=A0A1Y2H0F8_9FUNG|nr:hypothetical protein BCR41DRAFT_346944 [Lobosporangium transversale]KAF9915894.1 hypothetical protein BX616_005113 [Lobosporangium transversale]ORZ27534.1 hypothetical protein BCR41DRAFT_346944 [Lobosporangium transversale]|eukprot:XP_021885261.1 hypothetical protein BCR41DRAFT_346944 [Lobosporangium transversale]
MPFTFSRTEHARQLRVKDPTLWTLFTIRKIICFSAILCLILQAIGILLSAMLGTIALVTPSLLFLDLCIIMGMVGTLYPDTEFWCRRNRILASFTMTTALTAFSYVSTSAILKDVYLLSKGEKYLSLVVCGIHYMMCVLLAIEGFLTIQKREDEIESAHLELLELGHGQPRCHPSTQPTEPSRAFIYQPNIPQRGQLGGQGQEEIANQQEKEVLPTYTRHQPSDQPKFCIIDMSNQLQQQQQQQEPHSLPAYEESRTGRALGSTPTQPTQSTQSTQPVPVAQSTFEDVPLRM